MRTSTLTAAFVFALAVAAAVPADAGQWDQLIYAETSGTVELDPVRATDANSWQLIDLLFNGLMKVKPNLELAPDLAESYTIDKVRDPSGNEFVRVTFKLHQDRPWAGTNVNRRLPVDAEDVVFTLNRVRNDKGASPVVKRAAGGIERVRKVDASTVEVYYKPEDFRDDTIGNFAYIKVFSKAQWLEYLRRGRKRQLVFWGTGPYFVARAQGAGNVDLVANKDGVDGGKLPPVRMISREHRQDRRAAKQDLIIGNLDMMMNLTPLDIEEVTSDPDTRVEMKSFPSLSYTFLAYNHKHPLLGQRKVREAIARGVNREELRDDVFDNREEAARLITGPFDPILRGYKHDLEEAYAFDVNEAKQVLRAACMLLGGGPPPAAAPAPAPKGRKGAAAEAPKEPLGPAGEPMCGDKPLSFEMAFNGESETDTRTADSLAKVLKQNLGIVVKKRKLAKADWLALQDPTQARYFEMLVTTRVLPVNYDPYDTWHSQGLANAWRYASPDVDKILERARAAPANQKPYLYQDFHEAVYLDQGGLFLWSRKPLAAINKRFNNIDENRVDVFRSIPSWGIAERR
jgi:peptide/nickel transport system substrate-binding protein